MRSQRGSSPQDAQKCIFNKKNLRQISLFFCPEPYSGLGRIQMPHTIHFYQKLRQISFFSAQNPAWGLTVAIQGLGVPPSTRSAIPRKISRYAYVSSVYPSTVRLIFWGLKAKCLL